MSVITSKINVNQHGCSKACPIWPQNTSMLYMTDHSCYDTLRYSVGRVGQSTKPCLKSLTKGTLSKARLILSVFCSLKQLRYMYDGICSYSDCVVTVPYIYRISTWISLNPERFELNFRRVIFKLIFIIDYSCTSCEIAPRWMSHELTDDKLTLVQVMAWCCQATSYRLRQCWPRSMSPYHDVTRPQWVKFYSVRNQTLIVILSGPTIRIFIGFDYIIKCHMCIYLRTWFYISFPVRCDNCTDVMGVFFDNIIYTWWREDVDTNFLHYLAFMKEVIKG